MATFLCYNKGILYHQFLCQLKKVSLFTVHSKTKGFVYENIIRIRSRWDSFEKK